MASKQSNDVDTLFLVSTYTDNAILAHTPKGEQGAGVYAIECSAEGKLKMKATSALGPNVAFLLKHPKNDTVYASTECINEDGEILTTQLDHDSGELKLQGKISAQGKSTCYLNLHKSGKFISAVNYWDAKLASFPVNETGTISAEPLDVNMQPGAEYVEKHNPTREFHWKHRQHWPHTHCMVTEPYERKTEFVIDLGVDQILQYQVNETTGKLRKTGAVQLTPHLGPRHIIFHPHCQVAYLVNELQSSVSVFKVNPKAAPEEGEEIVVENSTDKGATLQLVQTLSTLPIAYENDMSLNEHGVWKAASHSSEIRLHPSGKFLYIGNRGHDSIAVYSIEDNTTGLLTFVEAAASGGKCPRNFNFSKNGKHLLVGNQDSNNVTLHAIHPNKGSLTKLSALPVPSPNYLLGVEAKPRTQQLASPLKTPKTLAGDEVAIDSSFHTIQIVVYVCFFLWFACYAWWNVGHQFDL